MFDISFAELMMIAVVALLAVGPDRLPKVARTMGVYTGRLQKYIAQVKEEVNREMHFDELQDLQQEIQAGVDQAESSLASKKNAAQGAFVATKKTIKPTTKPKPSISRKSTVKKSVAKKSSTKKRRPNKKIGKIKP